MNEMDKETTMSNKTTMKLKPNMLVHVYQPDDQVQAGMRGYVGEVMSFPTPDGTVMVRSVPGFAGTLRELPIDWLHEHEEQTCWVAFAEVKGPGSFPTDMLRYDSCVPVNFVIEDDGHARILDGMGDALLVARAGRSNVSAQSWCRARWESFLWHIKPIGMPEYINHR